MNPTHRKLWKSEQKKVSFVSFLDGNFVQVAVGNCVQVVGGWGLGRASGRVCGSQILIERVAC